MTAARRDFHLDQFLPYLVHRVGAQLADGFGVEFDGAGVSLQEWRVLAVLNEYGPQAMGDIARRTSITPATMTRLIGAMESRALVRRERPVANQRTVYVRLLEDGRAVVDRLIPVISEYERSIASCFSGAELQMLKSLLARLFRNVTEETAADNPNPGRLAG